MLAQGGDDNKREDTIRAVEQYLQTNPNADDRDLAEAGLKFLRAGSENVNVEDIDPDLRYTFSIQYLNFTNDMRGDRFDEALDTISNYLDNGCGDLNSLWVNKKNRFVNIARHSFRSGQADLAYQITQSVNANNTDTEYQLNFLAGYIQTYKDNPNAQLAYNHFNAARNLQNTDVNVPQVEFYLGLSQQRQGNAERASEHFTNATRANEDSFYGQLSAHYNRTPLHYTSPTIRLNPNDPPLAFAVNNENCQSRLMFGQRDDDRAVPASITKVMTLYTFAQIMAREDVNLNLDTVVRIPRVIDDIIPNDLAVIESLTVGREVSIRNLLVMVGARSDAVSAVTIAVAAGRAAGWEGSDREILHRFVEEMNKNAERLGMSQTVYGDVIGNNATRGFRGNISSPEDTNILMASFEHDAPNVFELSLGQSRITNNGDYDISAFTAARVPSSRTLQDNGNVIASKTGILLDSDPFYRLAAGYNQTDHVDGPDITGMSSHFSISVFGSDSTNNREDIMVRLTNHVREVDVNAFCLASSEGFRYHPTALPFYTARRQP